MITDDDEIFPIEYYGNSSRFIDFKLFIDKKEVGEVVKIVFINDDVMEYTANIVITEENREYIYKDVLNVVGLKNIENGKYRLFGLPIGDKNYITVTGVVGMSGVIIKFEQSRIDIHTVTHKPPIYMEMAVTNIDSYKNIDSCDIEKSIEWKEKGWIKDV